MRCRLLSCSLPLMGLALAACHSAAPRPAATEPEATPIADTLAGKPFAFNVTPLALRDEPELVSARLSGTEVLGLFDLSSRYDAQRGATAAGGDYGRQSLSQALNTALPVGEGLPLQLGVTSRVEQRLTSTGLLLADQTAANARWNTGDLKLAVDAQHRSAGSDYDCGLDASLSTALAEPLRAVAAQATDLRLGGQLCERLSGSTAQKAQIVSAETGWDSSDLGQRRLRLSRVSVQHARLGGSVGSAASGFQFGAEHAISISGFDLSQGVTLRAPDRAAQGRGWAAKSQLSRKVLSVPVRASWQRHDPLVWAPGSLQAAATETSLGFDLSEPLQQWLTRSSAANLSYHRVQPFDRALSADDQLRLGVTLGW